MATDTPSTPDPDDTHSLSSSTGKHNTPPYWSRARRRAASNISYQSVQTARRPPAITLQDNTAPSSDSTRGLWARAVSVDDSTLVGAGPGAYIVWSCTVELLNGGRMTLRKRYSEFETLRARLVQAFPRAAQSLPSLPPKSFVSRFRPKFLEKRRQGLAYFLNGVLLNPEFAGSPVLKDFVFS